MLYDFFTPYFMDGLNVWATITNGLNVVGLFFVAGFVVITTLWYFDNRTA